MGSKTREIKDNGDDRLNPRVFKINGSYFRCLKIGRSHNCAEQLEISKEVYDHLVQYSNAVDLIAEKQRVKEELESMKQLAPEDIKPKKKPRQKKRTNKDESITPDNAVEFYKAYKQALNQGKKNFKFAGKTIDCNYAKYLAQHLNNKGWL